MNQTMDMATRDMIIILDEVAYSHQKINIWARMHHSISMIILHNTY